MELMLNELLAQNLT